MAYPWAVVEVKPEDVSDSTEQFCFEQAANASAAAIRMYKRLVDRCQGLGAAQIPPVIAYTCVGHKVKVWLTFFDEKEAVIVSPTRSTTPENCMLTWNSAWCASGQPR